MRAWAVPAVAVVTGLVAVAAGAGEDDRGARTVDVPSWLGTALLAAVALVALGAVVLTIWVFAGAGGGGGDRRRRSLWASLATLLVVVAVLAVIGELRPAETPPPDEPSTFTEEEAAPVAGEDAGTGGPAWALGAIGLLLLGLAGVAVALLGRRATDAPPADDAVVDAALPAVATADLVALAHRCGDPRQAVLLAFAAAEAALGGDPSTRRPPSTSAREWAGIAGVPALHELVGRYELARFSHHAVDDRDRAAALDALDRIASVRA